jgi:protein gp37
VWRILTKRAELIADRLPEDWGNGYENVWLGVTVEMKEYLGRMDTLRKVPAAVRCVMCEPLLEELTPGIGEHLEGFHWLMVGGESGTGTMNFRSMVEQWARNLRDICLKSGVPFCFKQHAGKWTMTGTKLDGVTYHAYPEALETYKAKILRTPELDLKHWGEI